MSHFRAKGAPGGFSDEEMAQLDPGGWVSTCQMEAGGEHSDRGDGIPLRAKALGSWDTVNGWVGPKPSGGEAEG